MFSAKPPEGDLSQDKMFSAKPPEGDLSQDKMFSGKVTCKIYSLSTWIYRIYHQ